MASTASFLDAVAKRRTVYELSSTSPIPKSRIIEIVNHTLKYCPSPFNVRTCRMIILFDNAHAKLWDYAADVVPGTVPEGIRDLVVDRLKWCRKSFGTVSLSDVTQNCSSGGSSCILQILFFDDSSAYADLPAPLAAILAERPDGEDRAQGMHEFIAWTALAAEGLGCNIQHFHPGITPYVTEAFNVPESWTLKCQMVFGEPVTGPGDEPARTHIEKALRVYES